jgi:uncharacterized protein (DUF952 family)
MLKSRGPPCGAHCRHMHTLFALHRFGLKRPSPADRVAPKKARHWAALGVTSIYKICERAAWQEAESAGLYRGSTVDHRDGFIHFSTAAQVGETAARHFAGQTDLMLVAVDGDALGAALKWEPSRGGALFPHFYGALPVAAVRWARPLPDEVGGRREIAELDP